MIVEREPKRILIASGSDKGCKYLSCFFPEPEFSPVVLTDNAADAKRRLAEDDFDIVLVNTPLKDEFGTEFAVETIDVSYTGVIVLVKSELYDQVAYKLEELGVLIVPKPTTKSAIMQAVHLINASSSLLKKARKKNQSIQKKMDEIRIVNRAKLLLMEKLGKTEAEAHRFIEKQAMDLRKTKKEIAESIISTYDN